MIGQVGFIGRIDVMIAAQYKVSFESVPRFADLLGIFRIVQSGYLSSADEVVVDESDCVGTT